ncbi:MAG: DUF2752 domain-containing protein [Gemmataceae bacterium]
MPRRLRPWPLPWWARGLLVFLALIALTTFAIAFHLDPYRGGHVWQAETHTQLGLPTCSFKRITGLPCASCGMSTSFALAVRGDFLHSLQANWVGTLFALFGMAYVPWALISAVRGRWLWFHSIERIVLGVVIGFVSLLFFRWGLVLLMIWLGGGPA